MNCFNSRATEDEQIVLPPGLEYKKLFPKYKIIKPEKSERHQLKGTRIIISERILENEYYEYSKKYPWIQVNCFELIQPKEKFICIRINNKNTKDPKKIIVFSNGEIYNMCGILPILIDLSSYLRLNIITYQYPKINSSQGMNKKEQEMYNSALTVISYVYASPEFKNFILMGYSTGVYLNYKIIENLISKSKKFVSKLKNIISISPMWCFDSSYSKKIFHYRKYSNFISNLIKNTNSKLNISSFVSHGVKDNKIGYMISMNICARLNCIYQWYPKEGDHYNILLSDIYRRKLFKRLQKFLSLDDINISVGNEVDNSVISKITNQGIKVNITKDLKDINLLNVSSGNFFFKNDEKEKHNSESGSSKGKIKIKTNNNKSRKESGFSFLDISIQKFINTNELGENINELNNEEDFDKDNIVKNKNNLEIMNEIYEENDFDDENEKNSLKKVNNININNENNIIVGDESENKIIEVVSSLVTNDEMKNLSFEDENINEINKEKKGYLVNDSFGYMIQGNKENIKEINEENKEHPINNNFGGYRNNEELSFRKDGN
jgi:hypothetical protein